MLIAVTRRGKGIFHFAGELDEYNLTVVGDHVRGITRGRGDAELRIRLDAAEESAFRSRAMQWLGRLTDAGVAVTIQSQVTKTLAALAPRKSAAGARTD